MKRYTTQLATILLISGLVSLPAFSQTSSSAPGNDVRVTVTVNRHGPNAPAELKPDDVVVYQNNKRRPVVRWVQAKGQNGGLDLVILIDDSLDSAIGTQYPALKQFVRSLPAGSKVAIAYGMHGDAVFAQNFTTDYAKAAASIRLPHGQMNETSSIFMAFTDLVKHWPDDGNRHEVLVLSDGIDLYWGVSEALPSNNPDLEHAIAEAQRHGVNAYAIYADTAGSLRRNLFLVNAGQSCLSLLTLATGGRAYFQGTRTPIDFGSILQQIKRGLENQYLLTFRAVPGKKGSYDRLHLTTEQPDVELIAPSRVYVPGAAKSSAP